LAATLIFATTYFVLAVGRLPGLRIDRTGAAIAGAAAMLACNVLSLEDAYRAINFDTLLLLFGMMIVVANLRLSGFFAIVSRWTVKTAHRPIVLLAAVALVAGVFSAFFVNDTMCLVLTPLVLEITAALRRNPVPYLLAVAMASNVGSAATITGNPQNMMIGSFSGIPYREFAAALAPIALAGLVVTIGVIALVYRAEFSSEEPISLDPPPARYSRLLLWKSVAVSAAMVAFFFAGWPVPKVAIVAGAALLLTRRVKPEKVYRQIDWPLLAMFSGLFVVIAGLEKTPWFAALPAEVAHLRLDNAGILTTVSAILSNVVSNVPAVLIFRPFLQHVANPHRAWLALAMSSTLAGNLTLVGSVANLIVVQKARPSVEISFWEYMKAGVPITIITLLTGIWLLP
jgi:Na+/H+ antiporter NhaD/arsenite permease-like protein